MAERSRLLTQRTERRRRACAKLDGGAARATGRRGNDERGGELVEVGLLLGVLTCLLLGIVTLARAYNIYQTITRAAREGARMAVLPSSVANGNQYMDSSGVSQSNSTVFADYIAPALQAANLNPNSVLNYSEQVTWLDSGDTDEQCGVSISFQYPYQLHIPFTTANFTTINIPTHVQMRQENQPSGGTCQ